MHGGREFDILMDQKNIPMLMLHELTTHEHKRFAVIKRKMRGVGQATYVFSKDFDRIYRKIRRRNLEIVEPVFLNENSGSREFTFKLKDGYQFTVCDKDGWLYYWT